jgi:predicted O-methyltransferase YrrM
MDILLIVVVVIAALVVIVKAARHKSLSPFLPFKYNFGKRRVTMREVLRLLNERQAKVLVETGTARMGLENCKGDGASTIVFGKWARENGAHLHSVDISPDAIAGSARAVSEQGLDDSVTLVTADSIGFLEGFEDPVDFLYLDSYDYDRRNTEIQKASQAHHLAEIKAIEDRLHESTIILIDDCDRPNGGKGKLVIERLLARGWKEHLSKYQVILLRDTSA